MCSLPQLSTYFPESRSPGRIGFRQLCSVWKAFSTHRHGPCVVHKLIGEKSLQQTPQVYSSTSTQMKGSKEQRIQKGKERKLIFPQVHSYQCSQTGLGESHQVHTGKTDSQAAPQSSVLGSLRSCVQQCCCKTLAKHTCLSPSLPSSLRRHKVSVGAESDTLPLHPSPQPQSGSIPKAAKNTPEKKANTQRLCHSSAHYTLTCAMEHCGSGLAVKHQVEP